MHLDHPELLEVGVRLELNMPLNKPTMRDLPNSPVDQPSNALAEYVDSLPEKRSMFDPKPLSPGNPEHLPMLQQLIDATIQGTLDESHVKKLMSRNPSAAPLFANALVTQKLYKEKTGKIQGVLNESFQPEIPIPNDQVGPGRPENFDYMKAITRFNAMGETDRADKLAKQMKDVEGPDKNINSYNLALRAEGRTTGDPRVDALDPQTASNALARTMPPTAAPTTGGTVFVPRGGVPGKDTPSFVPNPKDLSGPDIEKLSDISATAEQSKTLLSGFKNEYGGFKFSAVGDAVASYKQRFGDDTGMGDWWNQYQAKKNVQRNKLFGGALTDTERKEWEKADINPGMTPEQIRKNLTRRAGLEQRAAAKLTKAYKSGSYNKSQIEAATGSDVQKNKRIKFEDM